MQNSLLMLLAGVVLAWFGGEIFVRGGVALARWARWPTAVIGVTVAAFGTSSPELLVAVHAALEGVPQISLGDVLGSNVVNIALVLAVVLALTPIKSQDTGTRQDWFVSLLVPGVLFLLLRDGWFSRVDAGVMMTCFCAWLAVVVNRARRHATAKKDDDEVVSGFTTLFCVIGGLGLLIGSAQFVVHGGKGVALALGWSPFIVGVVVVAAATSTPELATTLVARLRGHHDVGLGNIIGSNIFNALFIASVAALIQPYAVDFAEIRPGLLYGLMTTLLILPARGGSLGRWRGWILLAVYASFVIFSVRHIAPRP